MNIDEITLQYLMNPTHYEKYLEKSNLNNNKEERFIADKKFYRKRIINLTKSLFKEKSDNERLQNLFELYIKNLIIYFKEIDTKDILQKDYQQLDDNLDLSKNTLVLLNNEELVNIDSETFIRQKSINLNNFVICKNTNNEEIELPIKRDIDLKDPKLRKKGIKKKIEKDN